MNTTNNGDMKNWTDHSSWEQKQESVPKKRGCCFWGCLVPFVCLLVLYLVFVDFNFFRSRYPVGLDKHDTKETNRILKEKGGVEIVSNWIKEERKDQLLVGTWQIEPPIGVADYFFDYFDASGWEKTRLVISHDFTFVLIDPPKDMDYLHGFRKTLTGTWKVTCEPSLVIHFTHETDRDRLIDGRIPARGIRSQELWTLRENDTNNKYLRLFPFHHNEDFPPWNPSWKKVIK